MSISISDQKVAQPRRGVCSIQRARGNRERKAFPVVRIKGLVLQQTVFSEEYKTRRQRVPFVSINEHMIDAQVEEVRSGELNRIGDHRRTALYSFYGLKTNTLESFRETHWKLHLSTPSELYDLTSNVAESVNIAAEHPEVVDRLSESARRARADIHAR